jgi:type II secretory pathway pseudopilin PulG
MIVLAIISILAAVGVPVFMRNVRAAKQSEATLQLDRLAKNATTYYVMRSAYPQGTAAVLPAADGAACSQPGHKMAATNAWSTDPVWSELGFELPEESMYSYHYVSTSSTQAEALAVGDLDCDHTLGTYRLQMTVPNGTPATKLIAPTDPE